MATDTAGEWRKSSWSNGNDGDCVEVSPTCGIRDSKNPTDTLGITWSTFTQAVAAIKAGELGQ
jgi:hypothetical protein